MTARALARFAIKSAAALCACCGVLARGAVPVTALAFQPGGISLVSNGDRGLDIRSSENAAIIRHVEVDLKRVTCLAFHPNGLLLAVGGGEPGVRGAVRILEWPRGAVRPVPGEFDDLVTAVAFDPEGGRLAAASADQTARLWRFGEDRTPADPIELVGHTGPVLVVAFTPDGGSVITASADRSIKVWSAADGKIRRTLNRHTGAIHALAFRSGKPGTDSPVIFATAGEDRTVRVWQPDTGRMIRIIRGHQGTILALAWSPDGRALYSAGSEGIVRRLAGDSDAIEVEWPAQPDWIYALAVSPDGRILATSDWNGNVRLLDLPGAESRPR